VLIHYDPMISKLTSWGRDRDAAIRRMIRALDEYEIAGVQTTIPFCRFAMEHKAFRDGHFSTHFVDDHFTPDALSVDADSKDDLAALAATLYEAVSDDETTAATSQNGAPSRSPWKNRREI